MKLPKDDMMKMWIAYIVFVSLILFSLAFCFPFPDKPSLNEQSAFAKKSMTQKVSNLEQISRQLTNASNDESQLKDEIEQNQKDMEMAESEIVCNEPISNKILILGINLTINSSLYLKSDFLHMETEIEVIEVDIDERGKTSNVNNIIYAAKHFRERCPQHHLYGVISNNTFFNPRTLRKQSLELKDSSFLLIDDNRLNETSETPIYAAFMSREAVFNIAKGVENYKIASQELGYGMQFVHYLASQNQTRVSIYETSDIRECHPRDPCERSDLIAFREWERKFDHTQIYLIWQKSSYDCVDKKIRDKFRKIKKASKFDCHCS